MKTSSIEQRFCLSLVVFAVIVRLLLATGATAALETALGSAPAQTAAQDEEVLLLEILAPQTKTVTAAQPELMPQPQTSPAVQTEEPVYALPVFTAEDAEGIALSGACSYAVDKQTLLMQPSTLRLAQDGAPSVLIVHTHSSEAYTMEAGFIYTESDTQRTQDAQYSVIRVGEEVADALRAAGIGVVHDTQVNDYPNYSGAYERMRQTIEAYLAEYPSITMVLDIHRDAASDASGAPVALRAEVDGEPCAALMLVVGTNEGGLQHDGWRENLANALKLQALIERAAPGLCRPVDLRTERFNQHETPGSLLIEVGASGNTLSEALRTARVLAQAVVLQLRGEIAA